MGANMARRLKDQKFEIGGLLDVDPARAEELATELGGKATSSLAEVSRESDVIITVVTDDAAMTKIFFAPEDNLFLGGDGKLFINCATVSPATHVRVEAAAEEKGCSAIEACMASSITQAREGTLYLMLAGKPEAVERAQPVIEALSSSARYVGHAGQAAKTKALVNMVMNINTAALAEGLGLADALGLDLNVVREVFSQTGAGSRVLVTDGEDMQNRDHACFFSAAHAAKDSGIALKLAEEAGLNLPLAAATKAQYDRMVEVGLGELDKSGIAELTFKSRRG